MRTSKVLCSLVAALALVMALAAVAAAGVAGHLTMVTGQVDLLKGGKLPAVPLKVKDKVSPGDVIRTKSLSRAQITFIDDSTLTISPQSRVAIEDFMYEAGTGKRRAVLEILRGLALTVVKKILPAPQPDFVVKTTTAVVGVRGTEFCIRLQPNRSTILNFAGRTQVGNIFPEVSRRFLRAHKVAFNFGPWDAPSHRWVYLEDMQGTVVALNLPPTKPFTLTEQDRTLFMQQFATYSARLSPSHHTSAATASLKPAVPTSITSPGTQNTLSTLATVTVPPVMVPKTQVPPPEPLPLTHSGGTNSFPHEYYQ